MGQKGGSHWYNVGLACKGLCSTYAQSEWLVPYVPCGGGRKRGPLYLIFPSSHVQFDLQFEAGTHTHTRSLPLQIPPAGLSLLAKRENSPLVPRKGPASIFSQCGQREKAFIWQQQKNRTRDRNCAKLYANQCVVQFCIFQRLGSTAASPTMSPR